MDTADLRQKLEDLEEQGTDLPCNLLKEIQVYPSGFKWFHLRYAAILVEVGIC